MPAEKKAKFLMPPKGPLNRLIKAINRNPKFFIMSYWDHNICVYPENVDPDDERYYDERKCDTAHCLGGWLDALYADDNGNMTKSAYDILNAKDDPDMSRRLGQLFHMEQVSQQLYREGLYGFNYIMSFFDTLDPKVRTKIATKVLEKFRDTGKVDWLGSGLRTAVKKAIRDRALLQDADVDLETDPEPETDQETGGCG